ncbi:plasmid segregation protein ParM domain-containing protein, partial [Bacillus cereus]|uniref:plasmid segregation protein ParM domain-containing protein n=1 Tax=Bacillus cereus TaxID=1396 RepID=UPI0012902FEA
TGVPANHYNISSVTEDLNKNLLGKHVVNDVEFEIVSIASTLQPLASFVRKILNSDGTPNNQEVNKYMANDHKILVVDIGFGSTDYAEIVSGSLKKAVKSEGMREVYEGILNRAYAKEEMLRTFALNEFFIEGEMQRGNFIKKGQYNVDVSVEKHDEYKKKVSNVSNEMNQNGLKYSTYDEINFVGGGTLALDKELKEEFGNDPRVFFCKDAQFENARGYLIKAKSILLKEGAVS